MSGMMIVLRTELELVGGAGGIGDTYQGHR